MSFMFNAGKSVVGPLQWQDGAATFKLLLIDDALAYTPDPDVPTIAGLGAVEYAGAGYARGVIGGRDVVQNDTLDRAEWRLDDVTFAALGSPGDVIAGAILFLDLSVDSSSIPVFWLDGVDGSLDGSDFTVRFTGSTVARFRDA